MTNIYPVCTALVLTALLLLVSCQSSGDSQKTSQLEDALIIEENGAMNQAEQDRRIDYVEFFTTNMDETKKFYAGTFGWVFTDYGPDYSSFSDGRLSGGFVLAPEVTGGGPLVVLYAINLEEIEAGIRDAGGQIVREIFEFPGGRRFHFKDPAGNELAVWSDR